MYLTAHIFSLKKIISICNIIFLLPRFYHHSLGSGSKSFLTPYTVHQSWHRFMSDLPSHIKVALPALSPTMEMGTIVSWEKKEGINYEFLANNFATLFSRQMSLIIKNSSHNSSISKMNSFIYYGIKNQFVAILKGGWRFSCI